jgi:hypothetical protein
MGNKSVLLSGILVLLWIGAVLPCSAPGQTDQHEKMIAKVIRSGGFAARQETFRVYQNGKVASSTGATRRIPSAEVHSLIRLMESLDLPASCRIEFPQGLCADCYQYHITLMHPPGARTIIIDESQMSGQDSLSKLARAIRDILSGLK